MDSDHPTKRRKIDSLNDVSESGKPGPVNVTSLSVKPDKILKLRKIVAASCEKIQTRKSDDDVIISSVGSSPCSSPPPSNLTSLSVLLNPVELQGKLASIVTADGATTRRPGSTDSAQLDEGQYVSAETDKGSEGKGYSPALQDTDGHGVSPGKIPLNPDEFKALVKKLINEKMRKLEESYTENIIPDLEKKIAQLESENKYLEEQTKLMQRNLHALLTSMLNKPQLRSISTQTNVDAQTYVPAKIATVPNQTATAPTADCGNNAPPPATFVANGARYPLISHGGTYTTMTGQPRLYSGVHSRPGANPNAIVSQKTYQNFARANGPITAAVYPQPHNVPVSSPNHAGGPLQSPPTRKPDQPPPGGGYMYAQQSTNGVVIRAASQPGNPPTQPQYHGAVDRRGQPLPVNPQIPPGQQLPNGPPPDYQSTLLRQQQGPFPPGTMQINAVQHYAPRAGAPASPRTVPGSVSLSPVISSGPRQRMTPNQIPPNAQAGYPRPGAPPPLVRTQSTPHPGTTSRFQPAQPAGHPVRPNGVPQPRMQSSPTRVQAPVSRPPVPIQQAGPQPSPTSGPPRGLPPPPPEVSISSVSNGIVLSWNMAIPDGCAQIDSYQLFAYQNNGNLPHSPSLWKKLGIVKALPLPMACTLTQFVSGSVYHFAVRAIDIYGRAGNYSAPCAITLPPESGKTSAS